MYQTEQHRRALAADCIAQHGLSFAKWVALASLARFGECSMTRLARLSAADRTTLTRSIDGLIRDGLVERGTQASDRRRVVVRLTLEDLEILGRMRGHPSDQPGSLRRAHRGGADQHSRLYLQKILGGLITEPDGSTRCCPWAWPRRADLGPRLGVQLRGPGDHPPGDRLAEIQRSGHRDVGLQVPETGRPQRAVRRGVEGVGVRRTTASAEAARNTARRCGAPPPPQAAPPVGGRGDVQVHVRLSPEAILSALEKPTGRSIDPARSGAGSRGAPGGCRKITLVIGPPVLGLGQALGSTPMSSRCSGLDACR